MLPFSIFRCILAMQLAAFINVGSLDNPLSNLLHSIDAL